MAGTETKLAGKLQEHDDAGVPMLVHAGTLCASGQLLSKAGSMCLAEARKALTAQCSDLVSQQRPYRADR